MFDEGWELTFNRFCQSGEDMLCLDSFDIEEEDLQKMLGLPPYTMDAIKHPDFESNWDKISAALNGLHVRRVVAEQQVRLACYYQQPLSAFVVDSQLQHEQLTKWWKITQTASLVDDVASYLASNRVRWIARELVYITEDLAALAEGKDKYVFQLCERTHDLQRAVCTG
jgi:hypothetical protein